MATKKDLVEAYSFSRRRLVTAFVSGAPGGREVEPARPGRAVIGGIAIAVLLLAGAAMLKILGSPVDLDENTPQLLSEKESGADYVLISTMGDDNLLLRPVVNITSAMLLLGEDFKPLVVPREKLTELDSGGQIGILQAPATPPPVSGLIGTGWTACTGVVGGEPVGIKVDVAEEPAAVPTPGVSFVVRSVADDEDQGALYLIAESARGALDGKPRAYAYEVPDRADAVLGGTASSSPAGATRVPAAWLTTFPQGGALGLGTFGLSASDVGLPFPGRTDDGPLEKADVGDVLDVGDQSYLLTAEGEVALLDAFAKTVYLASVPDGRQPLQGLAALSENLQIDESPVFERAHWPAEPTTEQPSGELCSLLRAAPGASPSVVLARAQSGSAASAEGVEPGDRVATVTAGSGALVRSGGWDDVQASTRVLVDDRGIAYGVAGEQEANNLGYAAVPPEVVPDSWLELFERGVLLSIDAARCPPTSQTRADPCG